MKLSGKILKVVFPVLFLMTGGIVKAQETEFLVDASYSELSWMEFVNKAEENSDLVFYFDPAQTTGVQMGKISAPLPVMDYLEESLSPYELKVAIDNYDNVFITKGSIIETELPEDIYPEVIVATNDDSEEDNRTGDFMETQKEHLARVLVV
ncbi:MAG: hypothetical protein DWQ02_10030, partial [Bacteroidetes bacterium]